MPCPFVFLSAARPSVYSSPPSPGCPAPVSKLYTVGHGGRMEQTRREWNNMGKAECGSNSSFRRGVPRHEHPGSLAPGIGHGTTRHALQRCQYQPQRAVQQHKTLPCGTLEHQTCRNRGASMGHALLLRCSCCCPNQLPGQPRAITKRALLAALPHVPSTIINLNSPSDCSSGPCHQPTLRGGRGQAHSSRGGATGELNMPLYRS